MKYSQALIYSLTGGNVVNLIHRILVDLLRLSLELAVTDLTGLIPGEGLVFGLLVLESLMDSGASTGEILLGRQFLSQA